MDAATPSAVGTVVVVGAPVDGVGVGVEVSPSSAQPTATRSATEAQTALT
jgi:hypothetical protein